MPTCEYSEGAAKWGKCGRFKVEALKPKPGVLPAAVAKRAANINRFGQGDETHPTWEGDPDLPIVDMPAFWRPTSQQLDNLDSIGTKEGGDPTLYISIASYRDGLCLSTINGAFARATHPDRLYFGVVQQNAPNDPGCLPAACEDQDQIDESVVALLTGIEKAVCMRRKQIRLYKLPAQESLGPTFARHIGSRLYRGEYFALQLDAHITFINGWDEKLIAQWKTTGNERAVLSTYLKDVTGCCDEHGDSIVTTSPVMCDFAFSGDGVPRFKTAFDIDVAKTIEKWPAKYTGPRKGEDGTVMPLLHPFWAAGMSFSRGHFVVRVPYDPHTPMMFQGEESMMTVRAWTNGYDTYTPSASVVFHPYNRKERPKGMFWENGNKHPGASARAGRRLRLILRCDEESEGDNVREWSKYGLGEERPAIWFYELFGFDCKNKKRAKDICPHTWNGELHVTYTPYLRANGMGIDYSQVPHQLFNLDQ
jgi:hypothetical protein